jgi:hypothetical protein
MIDTISIEDGIWYYFTIDLSFEGFASFRFIKYINVNNDRNGAIVNMLDKDYFLSRNILLLPYTDESDYFKIKNNSTLSVWTFDASKILKNDFVDLKSEWPKNILDKAIITPSINTAIEWTRRPIEK